MFGVMMPVIREIKDIKTEAGQLNLRYERQEPEAILIFRKMVTDCLSGVQETLNTYNVKHDMFDFESELGASPALACRSSSRLRGCFLCTKNAGWEGSNDKVLKIMRNSDYFVPPTQCNEAGVPQGGYLDMTQFIADQGFKVRPSALRAAG